MRGRAFNEVKGEADRAGPSLYGCVGFIKAAYAVCQLLMVRFVTSQWLEPVTLGSVLLNVISHDTFAVALTLKVPLLVVSVVSAADVALVRVFWYSCPLTAVPEVAPQLSSV